MEDKVKNAIQHAQQVIDDFKKLLTSLADLAKGKLDIILILAQQLAAKVRGLAPMMSDVSQVIRNAIAEAKSSKTVLSQLKETITTLKNDPTRAPPLSVLDQTDTVVRKVTGNVQEVEAMEALLPVLLDKQYELIDLYEQLSNILQKDQSLADKPEMKELHEEMDNLMTVIFRQKESIAGPS